MPYDRNDERLDDPADVACLPSQLEELVLQREEDGCTSCAGDVMVDFEDFDRRHRYTVRCLSRACGRLEGWSP